MYNRLLNEINDNTRDPDDIPVLFKNKFLIFNKLYKDYDFNKLSEFEQYEKYNEVEKELNFEKTNINTMYSDMFACDQIYKQIYKDLRDIKSNNSSSEESSSESEEGCSERYDEE